MSVCCCSSSDDSCVVSVLFPSTLATLRGSATAVSLLTQQARALTPYCAFSEPQCRARTPNSSLLLRPSVSEAPARRVCDAKCEHHRLSSLSVYPAPPRHDATASDVNRAGGTVPTRRVAEPIARSLAHTRRQVFLRFLGNAAGSRLARPWCNVARDGLWVNARCGHG